MNAKLRNGIRYEMFKINYILFIMSLTCLIATSKEPNINESLIKATLVQFDKDTGEITVSLENVSENTILIGEKGIITATFALKSDSQSIATSISGNKLKDDIFIRVYKQEKKQISFKLRDYHGIKGNEIYTIELKFFCKCYVEGEAKIKDVEFKMNATIPQP